MRYQTGAFVVGVLHHACHANAQTIVVGGKTVAATLNNVVAAQAAVAGGIGPAAYQFTDAVLANLKSMQLSNASYFDFGPSGKVFSSGMCKTYPGDAAWPTTDTWNALNLVTGGALLDTIPIGAVCYKGPHYNAAECQALLQNWSDPYYHHDNPGSAINPLFQGATCLPQDAAAGGTCDLGGYPPKTLKITTVAQVQLAVNFARNTGVRLVVHNTGHDYFGKSIGAGALSIWTNNLKSIDFIAAYSSASSSYTGPAMRLGAGVEVYELYEAANKHGVSALGGECQTVGVAGGYVAGGGHSPLTSKYGLAADHVLSMDVVTPDGRFVTADEKNNVDLFWALRGGGGGTFGVVTSVTFKVYPKMTFSGMTFKISSGPSGTVTNEVFWAGISAYWRRFPELADEGSYGYSSIFPTGDGGFEWEVNPWVIPDMTVIDFKRMSAALIAEWQSLGFIAESQIAYFQYDNFYDFWSNSFPPDGIATPNVRTASRLFPKENWVNPSLLNDTVDFIQRAINNGSSLISYNIHGAAPPGAAPNAVGPAWRDAYMFAIVGTIWDESLPQSEIDVINRRITEDWTTSLRSLTPGGGTYLNEGDVMDPDWQSAFYGYDNYLRLNTIKQTVDPWGLFYAPTGVGSKGWMVENQKSYVTTQTGRLCRD